MRTSYPLLALILACSTHAALAATLTVTNANDSGTGSLRAAIQAANLNSDLDTIVFAAGAAPITINLATTLPTVSAPLQIDGWTQPGSQPSVRIDGAGTPAGSTPLLQLSAAACTQANCFVRGLAIVNGKSDGMRITSGSWTIQGNHFGTSGTAALPNAGDGLEVTSNGNLIGGSTAAQRNVMSGNAGAGLRVIGSNNVVTGNHVGTNAAGTAAVANAAQGLVVTAGSGNRVGGNSAAERNVIAGNGTNQLLVTISATLSEVLGNYIGIGADGSTPLSADGDGLMIQGVDNVVAYNVIAGIGGTAIQVSSSTTQGIIIAGNLVGLDATGSTAVPNDGIGIRVVQGSNITIGGLQAGFGNRIAGSTGSGVAIESGVVGTLVAGNYIGTNLAGTAALQPGATGAAIGGANTQFRNNVVSGNGQGGVVVSGASASGVVIADNRIGTNAAGTAAVGNGGVGVSLGSPGTEVRNNLVSGNGQSGVTVSGASASGVVIADNRIGTNAAGTAAVGNGGGGVSLGAPGTELRNNVISGNVQGGVGVVGPFANGVVIAGNRIGTNAAGTAALSNGSIGVRATVATNLRIGGPAVADRNIISGNTLRNLTLEGGIDGAEVINNYVGTDATGAAALTSNIDAGISIGGRNIQIRNNVVSGNQSNGISLSGVNVDGIIITGNRIGTGPDGSVAVPNSSYGIRAISGTDVRIGGTAAGEGNLISGNGRGVAIEKDMRNVVIQGNTIGLNAARNAKLPNGNWNGLDISAPDTVVGGTVAGAGNVIAGNQGSGILLQGETAAGTIIRGNFIGTNPAGVLGLGNHVAGIRVLRSHAVTIGGTAAGAGNTIIGNGFNGILHQAGDGISIQGNRIRNNELLGIELEPQGPEANDPFDADGGANFRQNFPVLTSALSAAGSVQVQGRLDARPASTYQVEIVHSDACDPSGLGEGTNSLGFATVQTDAAGVAIFNVSLPLNTTAGVVTALATAPDGSTSEFSPCHGLTGPNPGSLQIWRNPLLTWEGLPHVAATVVRAGGNAGPVSVTLSTQNDSAIAPADYTATTTTVDFADGEVIKSVLIPVVADNLSEGQEQFIVRLTDPVGGATLGAQAQVPAIIINVGDTFPMYLIDDVTLDEPASGQAIMTFTVTLTPNAQPHTINWSTSDGTAVAGSDYAAASGQLQFPPSATVQTQTISVPVLADAEAGENDEVFYVNASAAGGSIAVFKGMGIATIRKPQAPVTNEIFADGFD